MDNQIITQNKQLAKQLVQDSTRRLLNSIVSSTPDAFAINRLLQPYRDNGAVNFPALLKIPVDSRVPALVKIYGEELIHKVLTAMLTKFCNSFNVIRPMNDDQLVQCAFDMIHTSTEDHLSIEDYTLFLQGAITGKYGRILDRLDQLTIFEMLEKYREERHREYVRIKEERESNLKGSGAQPRLADEANTMDVLLDRSLDKLQGAFGTLKTRMEETHKPQ